MLRKLPKASQLVSDSARIPVQVIWLWNPRAQPVCGSAIPRKLTPYQGLEMPWRADVDIAPAPTLSSLHFTSEAPEST